jgi:hypothetical protein
MADKDDEYVSVLERGDMSSPAYRKSLEKKQALKGSHPELALAGLARSLAGTGASLLQAAKGGTNSAMKRAAEDSAEAALVRGAVAFPQVVSDSVKEVRAKRKAKQEQGFSKGGMVPRGWGKARPKKK